MTDNSHTTIQITDAQKDALDRLKQSDTEAYRSVLQRLIEAYESKGDMTEDRVRDVVREEVRPEALR